MAGAGYDIGASFSASQSSAASNNSPFSLTGGGGSYNVTINRGSGSAVSTPAAPNNFSGYLPWIIGGVLIAGTVALALFFRK